MLAKQPAANVTVYRTQRKIAMVDLRNVLTVKYCHQPETVQHVLA